MNIIHDDADQYLTYWCFYNPVTDKFLVGHKVNLMNSRWHDEWPTKDSIFEPWVFTIGKTVSRYPMHLANYNHLICLRTEAIMVNMTGDKKNGDPDFRYYCSWEDVNEYVKIVMR